MRNECGVENFSNRIKIRCVKKKKLILLMPRILQHFEHDNI